MTDTVAMAQAAYDEARREHELANRVVGEKARAVAAARDALEAAKREAAAAVPVDRSAVQLSGGGSVTDDHREIDPRSGQQKGYIVLNDAERAKGFVRPYRDAYRQPLQTRRDLCHHHRPEEHDGE